MYELTQKQRAKERSIRASKRELAAAQIEHDTFGTVESAANLQKAKDKLAARQKDMRDFIKSTNDKANYDVLTRKPNREWAGDMPKISKTNPSRRNINQFLDSKKASRQLKDSGISKTKAKTAIQAQLKAIGLKPKDFENLPTSAQGNLLDRIRRAIAIPAKSDQPRGKSNASLKRIVGDHTIAEDRAAVNPRFDNTNPAYSKNCQRCVIAYEARRRGYDVEAVAYGGEEDLLQYTFKKQGWPSAFRDPKMEKCFADTGANTKFEVEKLMSFYGDGARAIVYVQWESVVEGHVFIAEQIKGRTMFHDPQNNLDECSAYFQACNKDMTHLLRVDNLEFTEIVYECVRERLWNF